MLLALPDFTQVSGGVLQLWIELEVWIRFHVCYLHIHSGHALLGLIIYL